MKVFEYKKCKEEIEKNKILTADTLYSDLILKKRVLEIIKKNIKEKPEGFCKCDMKIFTVKGEPAKYCPICGKKIKVKSE